MKHRAGYAAIIGLPNSGKSTLLNCFLGQKLSIVSHKPQTTRRRIAGILSEPEYQVVFLDTPGILNPEYLLQKTMLEWVRFAIADADVMLLLLDAKEDPGGDKLFANDFLAAELPKLNTPVVLVVNKIDLIEQSKAADILQKFSSSDKFRHVIPVSALHGFNKDTLLEAILGFFPEHPKYYEEDIVSDEMERFFVTEIIREKIFELYEDEIPYSSEVEIEEFKEREGPKDYIRAAINIERASQKGIIIGNKGDAIKKLGLAARKAIEEFHGKEVFLELYVRVAEKWRTNERMIRKFGYNLPESDD